MIPIYICEDNNLEKEYLYKKLSDIILIHDYDMKIVVATQIPEEVLEHRKSHRNRSIYILDVDLKNIKYNGFTLAKQLRELDSRGFIIFVTTHEEMLMETFRYRLEAMDYLIKEETDGLMVKLGECLAEINRLATIEKDDPRSYYTVKAEGAVFHVPKEEILYLKTSGEVHRVTLYADNRLLEFRGDLSTIEHEIGPEFLRAHRSCLVKLDKINRIIDGGKALIMKDGSVCPLSRKGKALLQAFYEDTEGEA